MLFVILASEDTVQGFIHLLGRDIGQKTQPSQIDTYEGDVVIGQIPSGMQ